MTEPIRCGSCGNEWREDELEPFHDDWSRVEPGGVVPVGDCPAPHCGAFCSPPYGPVHELKARLAAVEDVRSRLLEWEPCMGGFEAAVWEKARALLARLRAYLEGHTEKGRRKMYQPKIRTDLIPRLYRLAKALNIPLTRLVNHIIEHGIVRIEQGAEHGAEISTTAYRRRPQRKGKPHADTA